MLRRSYVLFLATVMLTGCAAKYEYAEQTSYDNTVYTRESAGIRLEDDFYGYCNFDFLYGNDIPADMTEYSHGRLIEKQIDELLYGEIRAISHSGKEYPSGSDEQKIKDLFTQYLDNDTRNAVGISPLEKGFSAIYSAQTPEELVRACGMIYREYGVAVLPAVSVSQDHFCSGKNSLFLSQMELFYSPDELLYEGDSAEELQKQMTAVLGALGSENAAVTAYDAVTMLLDIAGSTSDLNEMTIIDMYNIYGLDELDPLIAEYFASIGISSGKVVVFDTKQLDRICSLLIGENLPLWKALAECELVYAYKDYLPQEYSEALNADSYQTDEEKAARAVKSLLEGEVGNIYSRKYLDSDTLAAAGAMTSDIISAYRKCIEASELLSENDRALCLAKLDNMTVNIGCPEESFCSSSAVAGSLLESAVSIKSAAVRDNLALKDSAPLSTDWYMTPQTFNALYRPQSNSITIPMALFYAPYFDAASDYYTNLGGLGFIIAHEIGHAFDSECILYDEYGNYRPGHVSSERTERLEESAAAYFGGKQIMGVYYIDGELTNNENAADLCGMQVVASMAREPDELRTIFESYANSWATLIYDTDAALQLGEDVHSPAEIRVNAVLSCIDEFYEAYEIDEKDGMYIPTDERVRVW